MESYFTFFNKNIKYKVQGKGTPILLLHGYLESLSIWEGFADLLAEKYKVIRMDIPGHGESPVIEEIHTMELMAESVNALLDHLVLDKVILTGHSMGGYITLAFLEKFSHRLAGFALFHSHPFADTDETKDKRRREIQLVMEGKKERIYNINVPNAFASDNLGKFRNEVEKAKQIASKTPNEGIVALLKGMMARSGREHILAKTNIPFLNIMGKKDNYIPFSKVFKSLPRPVISTDLVLEYSGHMGFIEDRTRCLETVIQFIESLKPGT